jgi:hypothetical protein
MPTRRVVSRLAQVGLALTMLASCKTTLHSIGCGENSYSLAVALRQSQPVYEWSKPGLFPFALQMVVY